jgi:hypothetical protein
MTPTTREDLEALCLFAEEQGHYPEILAIAARVRAVIETADGQEQARREAARRMAERFGRAQ